VVWRLSFTGYSIISFFVVSTIVAWLLYRRIFKRNKKLATADQQESQTLHSQTQAHVYNAAFDADVVTKDSHDERHGTIHSTVAEGIHDEQPGPMPSDDRSATHV